MCGFGELCVVTQHQVRVALHFWIFFYSPIFHFWYLLARRSLAPVAKFPSCALRLRRIAHNALTPFVCLRRGLSSACVPLFTCAFVHQCHRKSRWWWFVCVCGGGGVNTVFWPLTVHPSALVASTLPGTLPFAAATISRSRKNSRGLWQLETQCTQGVRLTRLKMSLQSLSWLSGNKRFQCEFLLKRKSPLNGACKIH